MKNRKKHTWFSIVIWFIGLCILIGAGVYLINKNRYLRYEHTESKKIELGQKIYAARKSIYEELNGIKTKIENKAHEFNQKDFNAIPAYLTNILKSLPFASAIGIAFEPYEYSKHEKLHATYIIKEHNSLKEIDINKYYDYLLSNWYQTAFGKNSTWIEPFLEVSTNSDVLRLVNPIFKFDSNSNTRIPIGVLFVDISRAQINMLVNKTIYDTNTYAFVISAHDTLISYPIESYLSEYKTLFGISQIPGKKDWHRVGKLIEEKHGGITTFTDSLSHDSYWVTFEPLQISNWFLIYVTHQETLFDIAAIRHNSMQIAGWACVMLLYFLSLISYFFTFDYKKIIFAAVATMCFTSLTVLQLYLNAHSTTTSDQTIIKSKIDLTRFKDFQEQRDKQLRKQKALYIPTGIMLKDIIMTDNKMEVQGLIWQKYDASLNIEKMINIDDAENLELTKLYETTEGGIIKIGWRFNALLNTIFDQSKYPFNILKLELQLFHPNLEKNIILMPDFDSYEQKEIDTSIGISKDIILGRGLHLTDSYFFYVHKPTQSDFGLEQSARKQEFPDLSFQVIMQQGIVNPLVAYLLPLLIISLILFYILVEKNYAKGSSAHLEGIELLGQTGALFLAIVFSHNSLRSFLKINTIAYLESYYFIIYAFTFLVASNCILRSIADGFIEKISFFLEYIYWPLMSAFILIVTLYFFY